MNSRETRRYEMFVRVQTFGTDNSADFAPASTAATNFATVTTVINGLNTAKAGQKPGRDTSKEVLLDAIRLDLQNITRTAAAIDQTSPGFADSFRPPAQFNPSALLTTADKFISQLAPQPGDSAATLAAKTALVAQFTAHEMPANFVAALQTDRAAYGTDTTQRETKREAGVGNIVAHFGGASVLASRENCLAHVGARGLGRRPPSSPHRLNFQKPHHGVAVLEHFHFRPRRDNFQRIAFRVAEHKPSTRREQLR
jgi:hypothetical protein